MQLLLVPAEQKKCMDPPMFYMFIKTDIAKLHFISLKKLVR